jgi:NarL family two-component system sensor histidine kinase YdfH
MPDDPDTSGIREEIKETWPFFAVVTLVIVVGYVSALHSIESLHETPRLVLFSALLALITALFWLGPTIMTSPSRLMALLAVQAAAAFSVGLMISQHWLGLAIFPALAGMAIGAYWPDVKRSLLAGLLFFLLAAANLAVGMGFKESLRFLPFLVFALAFVFVYVILFIRQMETRKEAQTLLKELEAAHAQLRQYAARVEELTLTQERERMGRELHDTLAQGVAGLIMQLEAIDCHLEGAEIERARGVVQQAMRRARDVLVEARRVIQALRASVLEDQSLIEAARRETVQFTSTSGIPCRFTAMTTDLDLSPEHAQHILRIIQESLSNIVRHAQAAQVNVELQEVDGVILVTVEDDGVGFDISLSSNGFGLAGMSERAAWIGGELRVTSAAESGTRIELRVPRG